MIGWTITALRDMYNAYSERSLVRIFSSTSTRPQFLINLMYSSFDFQDDICLHVLARCLMLIPFDQLENLVEDTQVSGVAIFIGFEAVILTATLDTEKRNL